MSCIKNTLFVFCLIFSLSSAAQNPDSLIHNKINQKVWKPFCESYASLDAATFNALHTDDVIRVNPWGIRIGETYKSQNEELFKTAREKGTQRTIELWFEHRKTTPEISYEVGYYKVTYTEEDGTRSFYGRFHVLLKNENGVWKIAQDWDTDNINGLDVTENDWQNGTPLTFN